MRVADQQMYNTLLGNLQRSRLPVSYTHLDVYKRQVNTKNTVQSSAIADAKIEYSGLGVVDDVQRPGWLVRILDWVYPF